MNAKERKELKEMLREVFREVIREERRLTEPSLTMKQVTEMTGCSARTIRRIAGKIGGFKMGEGETSPWRFDREKVAAYFSAPPTIALGR